MNTVTKAEPTEKTTQWFGTTNTTEGELSLWDWVTGKNPTRCRPYNKSFTKASVTPSPTIWNSITQRFIRCFLPMPTASAKWYLPERSEEHTSELQSLMRISYAVFCLKKKTTIYETTNICNIT